MTTQVTLTLAIHYKLEKVLFNLEGYEKPTLVDRVKTNKLMVPKASSVGNQSA